MDFQPSYDIPYGNGEDDHLNREKLELLSGFPFLKQHEIKQWDCEMMSEYSCLFQLLYYIYLYILSIQYSLVK